MNTPDLPNTPSESIASLFADVRHELDLHNMPSREEWEDLVEAIPDNSLSNYRTWWKGAAQFCIQTDAVFAPMKSITLTAWIKSLIATGSPLTGRPYAVNSLQAAIRAIIALHRLLETEAPDPYRARIFLRKHGRGLAEEGHTLRRSAILTPEQIAEILDGPMCNIETPAGARNAYAVTLGFNAWDRASDQCRHNIADIYPQHIAGKKMLAVHYRTSKTDKDSVGHTEYLTIRDDALDPYRPWQAWRAHLDAAGIRHGRLLRRVDRWGTIGASMSSGGFNYLSQQLAASINFLHDPQGRKFTSHGWRASGYTAARNAPGFSEEVARKRGRWSPNSGIPRTVYDRTQDAVGGDPMDGVGSTGPA